MGEKKEVEKRLIRVKLVDATQITGQVNIKRGSGYDRLSDILGSTSEDFLVVTGATAFESELDSPVRHDVLFLNKRHIL